MEWNCNLWANDLATRNQENIKKFGCLCDNLSHREKINMRNKYDLKYFNFVKFVRSKA